MSSGAANGAQDHHRSLLPRSYDYPPVVATAADDDNEPEGDLA